MVTWVALFKLLYWKGSNYFKITNTSLKCCMMSEITAFNVSLSTIQIIYRLSTRPTNARHYTHSHTHIYIYKQYFIYHKHSYMFRSTRIIFRESYLLLSYICKNYNNLPYSVMSDVGVPSVLDPLLRFVSERDGKTQFVVWYFPAIPVQSEYYQCHVNTDCPPIDAWSSIITMQLENTIMSDIYVALHAH
jgi:hypothetical protein